MADNPHSGHRKRMMEKLRRFGMDVFSDHEVLEILLYFAIRQGNTNPTAHRLLDRFGSPVSYTHLTLPTKRIV